jgi:hypothetical protein
VIEQAFPRRLVFVALKVVAEKIKIIKIMQFDIFREVFMQSG